MPTTVPTTLRDAAHDLLLGARCVGCEVRGRLLCPRCRRDLPAEPWPAWPSPVPAGLVEPWAAAPYGETVREMVVGHKERGLHALAGPLADLLALAVGAGLGPGPPVVLVPVPSRSSTVRARGHDPTWTLTRGAARRLGVPTARLLRLRPGVVDQSGLDAAARAANLAGSMHCPSPAVRRLARRVPDARLVVCDDVLTTGSTAREAQRALEAVGLVVVRIAAVAATPRRVHSELSADPLSRPPPTH